MKQSKATTKKASAGKEASKPTKPIEITPLSAEASHSPPAATRSRRNAAGVIEKTDRYKNIDDGLVPFKYSAGVQNKSSLNVRDAVVLCQKAYYNFSVFRNTIDIMTEFSVNNICLREGSKKSRAFFNALFKRLNLMSLQDRFFREYYRNGEESTKRI